MSRQFDTGVDDPAARVLDHSTLTITAARARLQWGYRTAAELHDCTLAQSSEGTRTVSGRVVSRDAFALRQPAQLKFVIPTERGPMVWPVRGLVIVDAGGTFSAELGPKERDVKTQPIRPT